MSRLKATTRRQMLTRGAVAGAASLLPASFAGQTRREGTMEAGMADSREVWLDWVERVSEPVLAALGRGELRKAMPVESAPGEQAARAAGSPLEALGRLLMGLAPWLELPPDTGENVRERKLRQRYLWWAIAGIEAAVDTESTDYMRFGESAQTLVDSSFLALALLRAPEKLMGGLSGKARDGLVTALVKQRTVQPPVNNWLLFAAMNEAALKALGADWDKLRVDYALRQHEAWYAGDGTYGDGPAFHADFYNSFVIQPYLLQLMDTVGGEEEAWAEMRGRIVARAQRYAAIQERVISPGGEYPVLGRSITYRAGAFHLLADIARRGLLPKEVHPVQVRGALAAVQRRTLTATGTFSREGWLQIGLAGHQPGLGETYISTGSLYLCSAAWLPLGLGGGEAFWSGEPVGWTQRRAWAGEDLPADHALPG